MRGAQIALEQKVPFICITATGGARMQEGLLSLMQMAKTTAMLTKLSEKKLPFISVLTDPTMGGVSASFAFMGDVVIAEPKALIGFAGPRVIENTVREKLPEGFQRAEFLVQKGAVDMIVDRLGANPLVLQLPWGTESELHGVIDLVEMKGHYWEGEMGEDWKDTDIPEEYREAAEAAHRELFEKLADHDEAAELSAGARTLARERFGIDRFVRDWLAVLTERVPA